MKFTALAAALAAVSIASTAAAHGPSRQKVTETVEIAAPPEAVWDKVGNYADMSWLPVVHTTEATAGNEIGSIRVLTLQAADGPKVTEELYKFDAAKMTYSYRITDVAVEVLPVTNYSAHITVTPSASGGSTVEWRGAFYRGFPNNDPPPELNDEAAIAAVSGLYRAGLDALKAEVEATQ